ncbi:lipopolysaccharide assembly protein LapA domain-containing protein [Fibrobacterota bacterium]
MTRVKTVFIITVTVLATIIFIQNSQPVIFRILFWELTLPRIIWMFFVLLGGMMIGFLLGTFRWNTPSTKQKAVEKEAGKAPDPES